MQRATRREFGGLTLRVAAREDLITLKLWAASNLARGARRRIDIKDLEALAPTATELRQSIAWCITKDGRHDTFDIDIAPVLRALGFDPETFRP